MKIESTGVNATPRPADQKAVAGRMKRPQSLAGKSLKSESSNVRAVDTLELSTGELSTGPSINSRLQTVSSGDYTARIQRAAPQKKLYPMSELNKKTDERLKQFGNAGDTVESLAELRLNDDRQDMVEIAKLRMQSGFYDHPEVVDEIARRIVESI